MIKRLEEFICSSGLSIRAFERKIDASAGTISKAILNNTSIQSRWLTVIVENFPQLNVEWLIVGKGSMFKDLESMSHESLDIEQTTEPQTTKQSAYSESVFMQQLIHKDGVIIEQARTIGKLEGKIEYLESEIKKLKENDAKVAHTNRVANVG